MNPGLDEVFPPAPQVWAELARHEMPGDHQFGKAVGFLEEGGTNQNLLAERLDIKVDYANWLLHHARKMKSGIIRVVVSEKMIAKFRTINPDIPMKAAKAQGAQDSYDREMRSEPALCTNPDCEWAWTRHGGQCS